MDQIEIEILQGPYAGKSAVFDAGELSFGRGADNTIVIDVPEVSREHGVLRCDEDGWKVVNLSVNGTTVNGKPIRKEERVLKTGDRVGVGKLALFKSIIIPAEPEASDFPPAEEAVETTGPAASPDAAARKKQQLKMYLATGGVLLGVLFLALAIIAPNFSDDNGGGGLNTPLLSAAEIERIITRPIDREPSEREAQEALGVAREAYENRQLAHDNLYQAYHNYKIAWSFEDGRLVDSETYREYMQAQADLIDRVTNLYIEAYSQVRSGQWAEAEQTCRTLHREYKRRDRIYDNVSRLLRIARSRQGR